MFFKVNSLDALNLNVSLSKVETAGRKDRKRLFKRISSDRLEYFRRKSL